MQLILLLHQPCAHRFHQLYVQLTRQSRRELVYRDRIGALDVAVDDAQRCIEAGELVEGVEDVDQIIPSAGVEVHVLEGAERGGEGARPPQRELGPAGV